ncbi:hypothetical protein EON77_00195 [bacterium]|nr:MAG: hypothetical protein EON77_00195 [bacterium]
MDEAEIERITLPDGWDDFEWSIYAKRAKWPAAAGLVFLPAAIDRLSDLIWASEDIDLDPVRAAIDTDPSQQWRVGILWTMVNLLEPLLTEGALTVHVNAVSHPSTRPLRGHLWSRDSVALAAAEGVVRLALDDGTPGHWVFLDEAEFGLLQMVYGPAGGDPTHERANLRLRHDAMAAIVLENMPAIAGSQRLAAARRKGAALARRSSGADPTPWELDEMFADAPRTLAARHQLKLIDRVADWFTTRVLADPHDLERRDPLKEEAKAKFAPYLSDLLNRDAWIKAVSEFEDRSRKGRRPKSTGV